MSLVNKLLSVFFVFLSLGQSTVLANKEDNRYWGYSVGPDLKMQETSKASDINNRAGSDSISSITSEITNCGRGISFKATSACPDTTSWLWDFGDNSGTSTIQNPTYTYTNYGSYTVTLCLSGPNCADTLTHTVTTGYIDYTPLKASDTIACSSNPLAIGVFNRPGTKYIWTPGEGLNDSTVSRPVFQLSPYIMDTARVYYLTMDSLGCIVEDTIYIKRKLFNAELRSTALGRLCKGDTCSLFITTNGNIPISTFNWETDTTLTILNDTTAIAQPYATSTYVSHIQSVEECTAHPYVVVKVFTAPLITLTPVSTVVCQYDSVSILLSDVDSTGIYTVNPPFDEDVMIGETISALVVPTVLGSTTYQIHARSLKGCVDSIKFSLTTKPSPVLSVPLSIECNTQKAVFLGTTIREENVLYSWSPTTHLDNSKSPVPLVIPVADNTYTLTAIDTSNGCEHSQSVFINVICNEGSVFMPSAFSPNSDRLNDVLRVEGTSIEMAQLSVYDRWGACIFKKEAKNPEWDGTSGQTAVQAGVYFYTLSVHCDHGKTYQKAGSITVLK